MGQRHPSFDGCPLRQWPAQRLREYHVSSLVFAGESRRLARVQMVQRYEADDVAVRCRQSVRHDLRNPGRIRDRRVRPAIWATPRLLLRCFSEALSEGGCETTTETRIR